MLETNLDHRLDAALNAYSELLVRTVCNLVYLDPPQNTRKSLPRHVLYRRIGEETQAQRDKRREDRLNGADWPTDAHSMAGYKRLKNLADCVLDVMKRDVPGDFIETGVWRGGACILMRGLATAASQGNRRVFVADSFEGLPPPSPDLYPADKGDVHFSFKDALGISLEDVQNNFDAYGYLDDNVKFLKGFFKDTLSDLGDEKFAIVRLDGDMYESTIQAIEALYPKLSPGGYLIVDDYGAVKGCRKAIEDYRAAHSISDPIEQVDWTGIYWKKGVPE